MESLRDERYDAALRLVQKHHAGQVRAGGVPVWHHLARVSDILETVLSDTEEGTLEERANIVLAALGHDSLEDTKVSDAELAEAFGDRALSFIKGMTNTFGDNHPEPYVAQVAAAEEGTRLIKLADLLDNTMGATYNLYALGVKWCDEFYLPIIRPMIPAVTGSRFETYPQAAERLKGMVAVVYDLFLEELERFRE